MKKSNDDVSAELRVKCLAQINYASSLLAQWERIWSSYTQKPLHVVEAFSTVKSFLVEKELAAYRNLLTAAVVFGDDEILTAKKMAIKRFLQEDSAIMHLWTVDGERPSSWLVEDEQLIRECIAEIEQGMTGKRKYTKRKEKTQRVLNNKVRD